MKNHQLINSSSGNVEFFTPSPIIEAARLTLGRIDLDPASSVIANEHVGATRFFTKEDDGLSLDWPEVVWFNNSRLWINSDTGNGLEKEKTHLQGSCSSSNAQNAQADFRPRLISFITKGYPQVGVRHGVENATQNTQKSKQDTNAQTQGSLRGAGFLRQNTEKAKLEEKGKELEALSTTQLEGQECETPHSSGMLSCGISAKTGGVVDARIAIRSATYQLITLSQYPTQKHREPSRKTSCHPAESATDRSCQKPHLHGANQNPHCSELKNTSCGFYGTSPQTVFMNMPFRRETNAQWINKFISEFEYGNVSSALCITFASTSEKWFRPLLDHPQAFLSPRTNYLLPDGSVMRGVTKGSVVTLLTDSMKVLARFRTHFSPLGVVKV